MMNKVNNAAVVVDPLGLIEIFSTVNFTDRSRENMLMNACKLTCFHVTYFMDDSYCFQLTTLLEFRHVESYRSYGLFQLSLKVSIHRKSERHPSSCQSVYAHTELHLIVVSQHKWFCQN